jgi:hypothetical protein
MADDLRRVERLLADLGPAVEWPPTPDLAPRVRRRMARGRPPGPNLTVLLLAAALAAALAAGLALSVYLGLRGATISRVQTLPSTSPQQPGGVGARLDLGVRYGSTAEAAAVAGFRPLVPQSLGEPDEVYYRPDPGVVTLLYRPRPDLPPTSDREVGALVMEARASVDRNSFAKLAGPGTTVEPLTVGGSRGFWISGAPHGFFFYTGAGRTDSFRLAGDVLVWNHGELVVRIESSLDRDRALAVAGTVR